MKEEQFLCPLCEKPMDKIPDKNGITVVCRNECIPTIHENVFGHGKNVKEAYEIAKQRYFKKEK